MGNWLILLSSLAAGCLFGVGLVISGMTNPAKVLNFLDIAGTFDPSLAFVMAGAVATTFVGYRFVLGQKRPMLSDKFHLPTRRDLDGPLLTGSALFGIGWGIGGYCPGPAVTAVALAMPSTLVFLFAMLGGMWIARLATATPAKPGFAARSAAQTKREAR
jgi:uncharacterized membrane protein YedE/YeeE